MLPELQNKKALLKLGIYVFKKKKKLILALFPLVVLIGLSHSFYIFSLGPLLKSFFSEAEGGALSLASYFSLTEESSFYSVLSSIEISKDVILILLPLFLVLSAAIKNTSTFLYQVIINKLCFFFVRVYRESLFSGIIQKEYRELLKKPPAQWVSVVMHDVFLLQDRLILLLNHSVKDLVVVLSSGLLLFFLYGFKGLSFLLVIGLLYLVLSQFSKRIFRLTRAYQEQLAYMNTILLEVRRRYAMIKTSASENLERKSFQNLSQAYSQLMLKSSRIKIILPPLVESAGFCLLAFLLSSYQDSFSSKEGSSLSLLIGFAIFASVIRPLKSLGEQLGLASEIKGSVAESSSYLGLINNEGDVKKTPVSGSLKEPLCKNEITIERLICHIEDKTIVTIEDMRLCFGKSYFIFGPSGSGKSTLLKSLVGLIPVKKWKGSLSHKDFSSECHYIAQRAYAFDESIKDIVLYGHPYREEISTTKIWKSLKSAELGPFVKKLPKKLNEQVSSLKETISGGQMQRLLLSRVFLAQERIFLLDEASSQLDGRRSLLLIENLLKDIKEKNKILIVVHHDIKLASLFDTVYSLSEGALKSVTV